MKYFYTLSLIVGCLIISNQKLNAAAVAGALEPTQILNNIELLGVNISDAVTAVSTDLSAVDETILEPVMTGMLSLAQQKMADEMVSWVNGGFNGAPLIVSDPEKYIKNAGLSEAKNALNYIPEDSIYGESIFNSLVKDLKDTGLESKIKSLSKSEIPSIIQENICNEEALDSLVVKEISDSKGNYDLNELRAKKEALYNYACKGDPNDPEQAAKLEDLNKQNSAVGGWDSWLALTGGENSYTKTVLAKNEINKAIEIKEKFKEKSIFEGEGTLSQKQCLEYAPTKEGEQKRCIKEKTLTPGKTVNEVLSASANSGLERLSNLMGEGLSGLLTSMVVTKLSKGFNSIGSSDEDSDDSNTETTISTRSQPKQDLVGNSETKEEILYPIMNQLKLTTDRLNNLLETDRKYLVEVTSYEGKVKETKACYDNLISSNILAPNDERAVKAYEIIDIRQEKIDKIKEILIPEIEKIGEAKNFLGETTQKFNQTNSTQEINDIFRSFTSTMRSKNYPGMEVEAKRKGEYTKNSSDIRGDLDPENTGTLAEAKKICEDMGGSRNSSSDQNNGSGGI